MTGQNTGVGQSCCTGTIALLLLPLRTIALLLPPPLLLATMPLGIRPLLHKSIAEASAQRAALGQGGLPRRSLFYYILYAHRNRTSYEIGT